MTTIAGPTSPTSSGTEGEGKTSPSSQGESGVYWQQVLGRSKKPEEHLGEFLRSGRKEGEKGKEVEVSKEAAEIAKLSLIKALFLNSERGSSYSNAFFAQVAEIILNKEFLKAEGIDLRDIPQDFEKRRIFFEDLVERFYKRFPDQAIALGIYFAAREWQMVTSVYRVDFRAEEGKEVLLPKPEFVAGERRVEIQPDGTLKVTYTSPKEETYEEYTKRIEEENKRTPKLMFWRRKKPLSEEEFKKQRQGQTGKYEIVITQRQGVTLSDEQKFYFEKLGMDPKSQGQAQQIIAEEFILGELTDFSSLLNEIAKATGVPPEKRLPGGEFYPLSSGNPILKALNLDADRFVGIKTKIEEEITQQAQREIKERRKVLEESQEASMRGILEQRKKQLEREVEELRRKQEEEGKKEEGRLPESTEVCGAIIGSGLLDNEEITLLGISRENPQLKDPQIVEEGLQEEIERLEIEIAGYGDKKDLLEEIKSLREQLSQTSRSTQVKNQEGQTILVSPADKETIEILKKALEEKEKELNDLNNALKSRTEAQKKLERLQRRLGRTVTIDGQTKTIREWIEEARREGGVGGGEKLGEQISQKEEELAEIEVLLEYFDENNISQRQQRKTEVEQIEFDWESITSINPTLREIFQTSDHRQQTQILKTLYILFGDSFLYPETDEHYKRMEWINIFLQSQRKQTIERVINFQKSLIIDFYRGDFISLDNKMKKLRITNIGRIQRLKT